MSEPLASYFATKYYYFSSIGFSSTDVRDVGAANAGARHSRVVLVGEPARLTIVCKLMDLDRVAAGRLGFNEVLKRRVFVP